MKKQKTTKQLKTKYNALSKLSFGGEFLSALLPYVTLGAIYYDEWFVKSDATKITTGGILALAMLGIVMFLISKNKIKDSLLPLLLGWVATSFIFYLLADIMAQISQIMWFGAIGLMGAYGLDVTSKSLSEKAKLYGDAIEDAKKETIKEQAKKEISEYNGRV